MTINFESDKPIYIQVAEEIENGVLSGAFAEETQVPSTTEISVSYKINPATVLKGMNILVEEKVLYKKRGVGMFVASGAAEQIRQKRKENFFDHFILDLIDEAEKLKLNKTELMQLIEQGYSHRS